ncbi:unnamed protein product [Acanthoscelides obtectus]|uniref:Uncharacterized protein n=1 Tax=Acanthoscelides obtectus TaxID=200917 RepID=A0A9P0M8X6_ACAOB|nr:unnamed protein product [Acanthoscelides obtectus]CAK1641586.1 hypothetical protein AOBTE_LOCUS12493 [Acanthoscelides obtectus]
MLSLLNYFQQEKDNGGPLLPLSAVKEGVAWALNISLSTITRIQRRLSSSNDNVLRSPGKKRPRKKSKTTDLSDAVKHSMRDTVHQMYSESNDDKHEMVDSKLLKFFFRKTCHNSKFE